MKIVYFNGTLLQCVLLCTVLIMTKPSYCASSQLMLPFDRLYEASSLKDSVVVKTYTVASPAACAVRCRGYDALLCLAYAVEEQSSGDYTCKLTDYPVYSLTHTTTRPYGVIYSAFPSECTSPKAVPAEAAFSSPGPHTVTWINTAKHTINLLYHEQGYYLLNITLQAEEHVTWPTDKSITWIAKDELHESNVHINGECWYTMKDGQQQARIGYLS